MVTLCINKEIEGFVIASFGLLKEFSPCVLQVHIIIHINFCTNKIECVNLDFDALADVEIVERRKAS